MILVCSSQVVFGGLLAATRAPQKVGEGFRVSLRRVVKCKGGFLMPSILEVWAHLIFLLSKRFRSGGRENNEVKMYRNLDCQRGLV